LKLNLCSKPRENEKKKENEHKKKKKIIIILQVSENHFYAS